jgi:type 2 lantibiotic biosynthesis protein LanM
VSYREKDLTARLEHADWYRAVRLSERLDGLPYGPCNRGEILGESVDLRIDGWKSRYAQLNDKTVLRFLSTYGLDGETFLNIVTESPQALAERLGGRPDWLNRVALAYRDGQLGGSSIDALPNGQEIASLLHLAEPLIQHADRRLSDGLSKLEESHPGKQIVDRGITDVLRTSAARQILEILLPSVVLELNVARIHGELKGETEAERFADFVARLRQPRKALDLLREYPVLARQVIICLDHWVAFNLEFLQRLAEDWPVLCAHFFDECDPGALTAIDDTKGDRHCAGHSVLLITFSSGKRLVYKPRPMAVARHFQELLEWLNGRGADPPFRAITLLDRDRYGWAEFITPHACRSLDEVARFFRRQGEYLALLYALEGTDFHYENLIAAGEHPILVDLETLFQPYIRSDTYTVSEAYRDSVLRIGLLPQRMFGAGAYAGINLSGLSAVDGQKLPYAVSRVDGTGTDSMRIVQLEGESIGADNLPSLDSVKIDLLDHVEDVAAGFEALYTLLVEVRDDLLAQNGPISRFAGDTVRVVLRPTLTYGLLLRSSIHPDVLRDGLDRDMLFGSLWSSAQGRPHLERIFRSEIDDLHRGDVPLFTTKPASRDVETSSGEILRDFFPETGMALARRRLCQLGDRDRSRQLWFVRASLATIAGAAEPTGGHDPTAATTPPAVGDGDLVATARFIGDRLETLALSNAGECAWIGLSLTGKGQWSLVPLGLDLYNGLPGVALFLSYLGFITGDERYTELAKRALRAIRRQQSAMPLREFSIGAFDGLGGLVFLLVHLGALWHDAGLIDEATHLAEDLRPLIFYDRNFDIVAGAAGCIPSLLALYQATGDGRALAASRECGDHLLSHALPMPRGVAWPSHSLAGGRALTGFAHGAAGIGWALIELSAASGDERFRRAGLEAFDYEDSLFSREARNWPDLRGDDDAHPGFMTAWCHGAPGIALARLRTLERLPTAAVREAIDAGLATTLARGFDGNHCLCHGSLGNIDILLEARQKLDAEMWTEPVTKLSGAILRSIRENGVACGVPLNVETPGLMTGLAGIGYGLLRLAAPSQIPSVLALEAPMSAGDGRLRNQPFYRGKRAD